MWHSIVPSPLGGGQAKQSRSGRWLTRCRAVLDAYGWPHDLGDDQILERLLALNLERAAAQGGAAPAAVESDEE
jgi:hypothetical protein